MTTDPPKRAIATAEARRILAECGISSPAEIDVTLLAFHCNAAVQERHLDGADGLMIRLGEKALINVRESIPEPGKKRFVIAHELGHVILHPNVKQHDRFAIGEVDRFSYRQANEEIEANYFAAELLMPEMMFKAAIGKAEPSFREIERLANTFQTTLSATAIQFVRFSREPCVFAITKDLRTPWFCSPDRFEFRLRRLDHLHAYSCAVEVAKAGHGVKRSSNVPAGAWFEDFSASDKAFITEESIVLGKSGYIYTLLWVHDAI